SRGPAAARNVGLTAARGRYVAFTDADTLPRPNWLEVGLERLRKEGVFAVEGAVEMTPSDQPMRHSHAVINETGGRYMTANMFYDREVLLGVGGFEEAFREQFLEDSDLAFRVMDAGYEIPFEAGAVVGHREIELT